MPRRPLAGRAFLAACWLFGCSSTPTEGGAPEPAAGGAGVLEACLEFATRLCVDAAGCCQSAHDAFDEPGCVEGFRRTVCRPGADAVEAGRATFNAGAVEACLEAHARAHAICVPSWAETLELNKAIYEACRVIDGTTEPGRGCTTPVTCKRPEGAGTAICVKNQCQVIQILSEGAECPFPSETGSVCDAGLTCDAKGPETLGLCVRATANGQDCDASVLESTQCGLGSYCAAESATCRVTDNFGGPGCVQGTECVSFQCDRVASQCATAPAVVSAATCSGPVP